MINFKRFLIGAALTACLTMPLAACSCNSSEDETVKAGDNTVTAFTESDMFTSRDKDFFYDESSTKITFSGLNATVTGSGASASGGVATINSAGTYIIEGNGDNGSIVVNAASSEKVQLVLKDLTLLSASSPAAINVIQADKTFITLVGENSLSSTYNVTTESVDALIFSKDDLTINGEGTLSVTSGDNAHGIVSKDDLVIYGASVSVTADKSAVKANDSVRIGGEASITLNAGTDAIHCENSDDTSLGYICSFDSDITVSKASSDGFDSSNQVQLHGGNVTLTDVTGKGIKATDSILITGGVIDINSTDDAIHSNNDLCISGGEITISTSDDGIHADSHLSITGGKITVGKCKEGLEGYCVDIAGGEIKIVSNDDGINASGGSDSMGGTQDNFTPPTKPGSGKKFTVVKTYASTSEAEVYIKISGGKTVIKSSGDGVDSNGNLYVTGGELYVTQLGSGNGALDKGDSSSCVAQITGGTVVACGSSDMAVNFNSGTQCSIMLSVNSTNGEAILKSGDEVLISFTPEGNYTSVVFSSPALKSGETYTVLTGTNSTSVKTSSTNTTVGGNGGGQGGMQNH